MRSLQIIKASFALICAAGLFGCLVSETAILTSKNATARPLGSGAYTSCEFENGEANGSCQDLTITRGKDGLFVIASENDKDTYMRFRRIGRRAYAAQLHEKGDDDGFVYYYASGDRNKLSLVLMMCENLPEALRAKLVSDGDMEPAEEDDFSICKLNNLRGLKRAARAYYRDEADGELLELVFTPAANDADQDLAAQ